MDFKKILRIGTSSLVLNLLPNISNAGLVKINDTIYDVKKDYSVFLNNQKILDRGTIKKALLTDLVTQEIKEDKITIFGYKLLGTLVKGQELTMKYSSQIEAGLTFPIKLLVYAVGGGTPEYDAIRDLTKKDLESTIEELEAEPSKVMKNLAYHYFSEVDKRYKENVSIIKKVRNGQQLSFEEAVKFIENSEYVEIYGGSAKNLYGDTINLRPLEKRWGKKLIEELTGDLIPKHILDKIVYKIKDEYAPLKNFENTIRNNKNNIDRKRGGRDAKLESLVNQAIFSQTSTMFDRKEIEELFREQGIAIRTRNINKYMSNVYGNSPYYSNMRMAATKLFSYPGTIMTNTQILNVLITGNYATVLTTEQIFIDGKMINANSKYYLVKDKDKWKFSKSESDKVLPIYK